MDYDEQDDVAPAGAKGDNVKKGYVGEYAKLMKIMLPGLR